jgi:hypothetical protein
VSSSGNTWVEGSGLKYARTFCFGASWGTRTVSFSDFFSETGLCSPAVGATGATATAVVFAVGTTATASELPLPESRASASKRSRSISSSGKPSVIAILPEKGGSPVVRNWENLKIFKVRGKRGQELQEKFPRKLKFGVGLSSCCFGCVPLQFRWVGRMAPANSVWSVRVGRGETIMLFIGHAVIGQQVRLETRPVVTVGQLRVIPIKGSQSPHAVPSCHRAATRTCATPCCPPPPADAQPSRKLTDRLHKSSFPRLSQES